MNLSFFFLWLNQSWTWNWIQAAARRFRDVAGTKEWRVMSSRLTVRGFGSRRRGFLTTRSSGTNRPKRVQIREAEGDRKRVPGDDEVHDGEGLLDQELRNATEESDGNEGDSLLPLVGACLIDDLARAVQASERAKLVGGVERVELESLDERFRRPSFGGVEVLPGDDELGDGLGGRMGFLPLQHPVLDRGVARVHVALHPKVVDDVALE